MLRAIVGSLGNDPFQFHCSPAVCQLVWNEFRRKTFFIFFFSPSFAYSVHLSTWLRATSSIANWMGLPLRLGPIVMADILKWPNATRERRCRRTVSERESAHGANVKFTTRFPRLIFNRFQRNIKDLPVLDGRSHNHVKFAACCHADARATPGSHAVYTQKVFFFNICRVHLSGLEHPTQHDCLVGKCKAIRSSRHNCGSSLFFLMILRVDMGVIAIWPMTIFAQPKKKTHSAVSFKHRDPNRVWPLFLLLLLLPFRSLRNVVHNIFYWWTVAHGNRDGSTCLNWMVELA